MLASIQRQRNAQRRAEAAARAHENALGATGGEGHKAPGTFEPRSHGWCGSHNQNTKANSGTRHKAYPRGLEGSGPWVSVGGAR